MEIFPNNGIDFSDEAADSLKSLPKSQCEYILTYMAIFYVHVVDLHGDQLLGEFSESDKAIIFDFFEGRLGDTLWVKASGFLVGLRRRNHWGLRVAKVILAPTLH